MNAVINRYPLNCILTEVIIALSISICIITFLADSFLLFIIHLLLLNILRIFLIFIRDVQSGIINHLCFFCFRLNQNGKSYVELPFVASGRTRTFDLWFMGPMSCHCSTALFYSENAQFQLTFILKNKNVLFFSTHFQSFNSKSNSLPEKYQYRYIFIKYKTNLNNVLNNKKTPPLIRPIPE